MEYWEHRGQLWIKTLHDTLASEGTDVAFQFHQKSQGSLKRFSETYIWTGGYWIVSHATIQVSNALRNVLKRWFLRNRSTFGTNILRVCNTDDCLIHVSFYRDLMKPN